MIQILAYVKFVNKIRRAIYINILSKRQACIIYTVLLSKTFFYIKALLS